LRHEHVVLATRVPDLLDAFLFFLGRRSQAFGSFTLLRLLLLLTLLLSLQLLEHISLESTRELLHQTLI